MWVLFMVAESICLIFGSLVCAVLLCFLSWRLADLIGHPEISGLIVAVAAIAALAIPFTESPFLRLTMLFALGGVVPLWLTGRMRRAETKGKMPTFPVHRAH